MHQVITPLPVLSEVFLPASSGAIASHYDAEGKVMRHSRIVGNDGNTPVLCAVFCASAFKGLQGFVPEGDGPAYDAYHDENLLASDLMIQIEKDMASQGVSALSMLKSEEAPQGDIYQFGVCVPLTVPVRASHGGIELSPNNHDLAVFNRYLLDRAYISKSESDQFFSARVRHLSQQF